MSFFDTSMPERKKFAKIKFLTLTPGAHITRVLGGSAKQFIHYIASQRVTILCLGDDCPICKANKKIMYEHPDDFVKQDGFISRQPRFFMNILDRTNGKICPECGAENKRGANNQFSPICWSCETVISNVEIHPLDSVKVLGISKTNADFLNTFDSNTLTEAGERVGINNFDIVWTVVKGANNKNMVSPSVGAGRDVVEVPAESLFDLSQAVITLTEPEIHELLKGVSLRDIFLARRHEKETELGEVSEDDLKSVEDSVSSLFNA